MYQSRAVSDARFCSSTVPCVSLCWCRKLLSRGELARDTSGPRARHVATRDTCIHSHTMLAGANGLKCRDRVQTGVETGVEIIVNHEETVETA